MKKGIGLSNFDEAIATGEKYLAVRENFFESHSCRNNFFIRSCTT
jgi:hypothetical protein